MSKRTLEEIYGVTPKKRSLAEIYGVNSADNTDTKMTLMGRPLEVAGQDPLQNTGLQTGLGSAGKGVQAVAGAVYDPAVQMGLGVANTGYHLAGKEKIQNLPSLANLAGDDSAPNIAAPGYDQQGNYIGKLKAAEQMIGAAGMTALNVATAGRGSSIVDGVVASPLGKYAIGKTTPAVSRMFGATLREGSVGAGYGASSAMSEGGDVGDVIKNTAIGTGLGIAGGATLAAGSSALGKLGGVSEKLVDNAINLERAGDKAGAAAARATPEYQQFIKANNLTDSEIIKKTDLQLAELKKFEDEGIGRASSASTAGKQARKQNKIQDEQRESFVKYARESSEATDANIADYSQVVGSTRQEVIDAARSTKAEVMPLTTAEAPSFIKKVVNEMSSDGMYGTDRNRAQKALTDDLIARIDQVKSERRNFDIGDYYNWKTSSNKSFGNESFGGALDTAIGNVIRRDLRAAETKATDKTTKAILKHLIESDNQLSSLKQAGEYNKFLQTLGQGRASRLLNLFAGFGLSGGNPIAGIGIAMMTQNIQQRVLASRGNRIYRNLTGKIKSGTTDELIGNTANVVKMLKGKGVERSQERKLAKSLASMAREYTKSVKSNDIAKAERISKKVSAVEALMNQLEQNKRKLLPARATPATIPMGGRNSLNQQLDASGKPINTGTNSTTVTTANRNRVSINPKTNKFQTSYNSNFAVTKEQQEALARILSDRKKQQAAKLK